MNVEMVVAAALLDLKRAMTRMGLGWALIGGQSLRAYGVPRNTEDADALVEDADLEDIAFELVEKFQWTPLVYDKETDEDVEAAQVMVQFMDDPVLFDMGVERRMIMLRTPLGLHVDLLAAQHPVEREMIEDAIKGEHQGVTAIPIAPLGGVLLVKTKADRTKDIAAIEQTAEHLPQVDLKAAVAWARKRDPATADDLQAILSAVRTRRTPKSSKAYTRKKSP